MKRYTLILLILFPMILCGCFDSEDEIIAKYEYRVEITPLNNTPITLFVPFPIDIKNNDEPSIIIFNKLDIISGVAGYNLEETEREIALEINGSNNIILEANGNFLNKEDMPTFISLHELDENGKRKESGTTNFWIYSNGDASIEIRYYLKEVSHPYLLIEYEINGDLFSGWNLVQGYIKSEVA